MVTKQRNKKIEKKIIVTQIMKRCLTGKLLKGSFLTIFDQAWIQLLAYQNMIWIPVCLFYRIKHKNILV